MFASDPYSRWTRRRVCNTGFYTLVGMLIGGLLTSILSIMFLILARAADQWKSPGFPIMVCGGFVGGFIAYFVVRRASFGTCTRHPAAPAGIALGHLLGGILAVIIWSRSHMDWFALLAFLIAAPQPYAALVGGRRGIVECLGQPILGVGTMCASCGYDLCATKEHWPCPECGGKWRLGSEPSDATRFMPPETTPPAPNTMTNEVTIDVPNAEDARAVMPDRAPGSAAATSQESS